MNEDKDLSAAAEWLRTELEDTLDEDQELELSDETLTLELAKIYRKAHPDALDRHVYFQALMRLQSELIKLQDWVAHRKEKVVVLFEGATPPARAASSSASPSG